MNDKNGCDGRARWTRGFVGEQPRSAVGPLLLVFVRLFTLASLATNLYDIKLGLNWASHYLLRVHPAIHCDPCFVYCVTYVVYLLLFLCCLPFLPFQRLQLTFSVSIAPSFLPSFVWYFSGLTPTVYPMSLVLVFGSFLARYLLVFFVSSLPSKTLPTSFTVLYFEPPCLCRVSLVSDHRPRISFFTSMDAFLRVPRRVSLLSSRALVSRISGHVSLTTLSYTHRKGTQRTTFNRSCPFVVHS